MEIYERLQNDGSRLTIEYRVNICVQIAKTMYTRTIRERVLWKRAEDNRAGLMVFRETRD